MEFIICLVIAFSCTLFGYKTATEDIHDRCVAKYAEMPHNKVDEHCKTLLKFEKESK